MSTKDDLDDDIINDCVKWLSDFTQDSKLKTENDEYGNYELDKQKPPEMGFEPDHLLLPEQMLNEKSKEHISMNQEISSTIYKNILESLEATVTKDDKKASPEPQSSITENNPKDFKFLNEELPIHDIKHMTAYCRNINILRKLYRAN